MSNRVVVEISGPQFVQSAVEMSKGISLQTIFRLNVHNLTGNSVSALQSALNKLRNYFANDGSVMISTSQALSNGTASVLSSAAGVPVYISNPTFQWWGAARANAAARQMQISDSQQAQTIHTQMDAQARKDQMQRWQISSDLQTKIFGIQQTAKINSARSAQKAFQMMNSYIRS